MKDSALRNLSYSFAVRIVKLSRFLQEEKREYIISRQIVKSGTSIGANLEEASGAQSHNDFIAKLHISLKEAKETHFCSLLEQLNKHSAENQVRKTAKDAKLAEIEESQNNRVNCSK